MDYIIIAILVGAVILIGFQALGLVLILTLLKKQDGQADQIRNSDTLSRKFCYRVDKTAEEIVSLLSPPGRFQDYRYSFDREEMIITFFSDSTEQGARYGMFLYPDETGCDLRVEAIDDGGRDYYPWIQNPFWQHMLEARPIPYFEEEKR